MCIAWGDTSVMISTDDVSDAGVSGLEVPYPTASDKLGNAWKCPFDSRIEVMILGATRTASGIGWLE